MYVINKPQQKTGFIKLGIKEILLKEAHEQVRTPKNYYKFQIKQTAAYEFTEEQFITFNKNSFIFKISTEMLSGLIVILQTLL